MRDEVTTVHGTQPIRFTPEGILAQAKHDLARFILNKGRGSMGDHTPYGFHPKHLRRAKGDICQLLDLAVAGRVVGLKTSIRQRYILYTHTDEMKEAWLLHRNAISEHINARSME